MIKKILLVAALLFTASTSSFAASDDVYWACSNLVTDYAIHRDQFNAKEFANLFTEDASLTVVSQTWVGRAEIEQRIEGLKTGSTIRHEMSTIRIVPIDADHATGVSYATIYSAPGRDVGARLCPDGGIPRRVRAYRPGLEDQQACLGV